MKRKELIQTPEEIEENFAPQPLSYVGRNLTNYRVAEERLAYLNKREMEVRGFLDKHWGMSLEIDSDAREFAILNLERAAMRDQLGLIVAEQRNWEEKRDRTVKYTNNMLNGKIIPAFSEWERLKNDDSINEHRYHSTKAHLEKIRRDTLLDVSDQYVKSQSELYKGDTRGKSTN